MSIFEGPCKGNRVLRLKKGATVDLTSSLGQLSIYFLALRDYHIYSQTSITRSRREHFKKFEPPEERIRFALRVILTSTNSPHSKGMSAKGQTKRTSSQPMFSRIPRTRAIPARAIEV